MDASTSQRETMKELVLKLQRSHPELSFVEGDAFQWSPSRKEITYAKGSDTSSTWSLLHEVSHALLEHTTYRSDMELLQKEVQAWEHAQKISDKYAIVIDQDFVQDCLDSYRDWLYKRSSCPSCSLQGVQDASGQYSCINCKHTWVVTAERFCRPYRRSQ